MGCDPTTLRWESFTEPCRCWSCVALSLWSDVELWASDQIDDEQHAVALVTAKPLEFAQIGDRTWFRFPDGSVWCVLADYDVHGTTIKSVSVLGCFAVGLLRGGMHPHDDALTVRLLLERARELGLVAAASQRRNAVDLETRCPCLYSLSPSTVARCTLVQGHDGSHLGPKDEQW